MYIWGVVSTIFEIKNILVTLLIIYKQFIGAIFIFI